MSMLVTAHKVTQPHSQMTAEPAKNNTAARKRITTATNLYISAPNQSDSRTYTSPAFTSCLSFSRVRSSQLAAPGYYYRCCVTPGYYKRRLNCRCIFDQVTSHCHRQHDRSGRGGEVGGETSEQRGERERECRREILSHDCKQEQRNEHGRAVVRLQRCAHSQTGEKGKTPAKPVHEVNH